MSDELRPRPGWAHTTGLIAMTPDHVPIDANVRAALEDRLHRYCWGFDERRHDVLANCFTEDAVWRANVMGETEVGPFVGHAAVLTWLTRYWDHQIDQRRHLVLNFVVNRVEEDTASALAYLLLMGASDASSQMESMGIYHVDFRREGALWRIAVLSAGFDSPYWKREVADMSPRLRELFGITVR